MTTERDEVAKAINDARALMEALRTTDWQCLHVQSGDAEIFLGKAGATNPMRQVAVAPPAAPVQAAAPQPAPRSTPLVAPHVASLVDVLPVGTVVKAGDAVATVRVLDDAEKLPAPASGTITAVNAAPGALLEYGATLLSIDEA